MCVGWGAGWYTLFTHIPKYLTSKKTEIKSSGKNKTLKNYFWLIAKQNCTAKISYL